MAKKTSTLEKRIEMETIKERPILFSGEMVRALLAGQKTQTRRIVKTSSHKDGPQFLFGPSLMEWQLRVTKPMKRRSYSFMGCVGGGTKEHPQVEINLRCPYGLIGDRLWVRETFMPMPHLNAKRFYRATDRLVGGRWKPSIFMPRAASRITLEITNIRIGPLNDISRGDCMAEGCPFPNLTTNDPQKWYADLWESINEKGSWDKNPWVWVIEFKRI